jgi:HEAT repeat protein
MTLIGAAARAGDDRERFRRLLVEAIGSPDAELRRQAAVWLAEVGVPEDRAALATLQADDDARVRMAAASARLRIEGRLLLR